VNSKHGKNSRKTSHPKWKGKHRWNRTTSLLWDKLFPKMDVNSESEFAKICKIGPDKPAIDYENFSRIMWGRIPLSKDMLLRILVGLCRGKPNAYAPGIRSMPEAYEFLRSVRDDEFIKCNFNIDELMEEEKKLEEELEELGVKLDVVSSAPASLLSLQARMERMTREVRALRSSEEREAFITLIQETGGDVLEFLDDIKRLWKKPDER
jgi:hypothetical protein